MWHTYIYWLVVLNGECCQQIFLSGRTVHEYFRLWSQFDKAEESSLLDRLLKELVIEVRISNDRDEEPSCVIIDSFRYKNTDTATEYDAGKKTSGIKRHFTQKFCAQNFCVK